MIIFVYIIIIVALLLILLNKKMRFYKVFVAQFKIFYNNANKKLSWIDIITYFLLPIIIGLSLVCGLDFKIPSNLLSDFVTIYSLLLTILIGVLSLLIVQNNKVEIKHSKQSDIDQEKWRKSIIQETIIIIANNMIISIIIIILIFCLKNILNDVWLIILNVLMISLIILSLEYTMLILKRSLILVGVYNENEKDK